jgi:hypothetical protein
MKSLFSFLHPGALTPGVSREREVLAKFGRPADERRLPDGTRVLDFPRQPEGTENWRVILGPDGTVRSIQQLVEETMFAGVIPGLSRAQVLDMLGRPSQENSYPNIEERVLSWRYLEFGNRMMFFNAHFDSSGRLKRTSRTPDPSRASGE